MQSLFSFLPDIAHEMVTWPGPSDLAETFSRGMALCGAESSFLLVSQLIVISPTASVKSKVFVPFISYID
ncbi:hypothetical protein HMPREF2890_01450 [Porphyromonas sp. HMSC065F10]|nr:hypothetical protein HMPREF2890_01450 [Porphyromonas sp. HMSC065F10]